MRFKCICAYDGTTFSGWQSQPGGNTVQDIIEKRLAFIFKKPVRIHGSGRTDAGVHAKGQSFHFDADWKHPVRDLEKAFKSNIPESIQITNVKLEKEDFHARFSAIGKCYSYSISTKQANPMETRYTWSIHRKLDIKPMLKTAELLIGKHDFTAFSARRNDGSDEQLNPVKELRMLNVKQSGSRIRIVTEADGYLYKMVRMLTGALVEVGLGKHSPDDILKHLRSKTRLLQIQTAPARGLCLEKVYY